MKFYNDYLNEYKRGLTGYSTIAIIGQSCLASIAVMLILMQGAEVSQVVQLSLITIVCMAYNAAILSQQKAKISFNILIMSVVLSIILIAINL